MKYVPWAVIAYIDFVVQSFIIQFLRVGKAASNEIRVSPYELQKKNEIENCHKLFDSREDSRMVITIYYPCNFTPS